VGLVALWRCYRAEWRVEARFVICFLGLAVVGLGSAAFHGTLLHVAQVLDELPMVYCSLVMAYCLVARTKDVSRDAQQLRRWQLGFSLYGAGFTAAYFLSPYYFVLFIASFAAVVTYLVLQGWRIVFRLSDSPALRKIYLIAAGSFVAAVGVFWIPERALSCAHPFQLIHPHLWFHLLAMVGTYGGFLLALYDRLALLEQDPVLRTKGLPWVAPRTAG
jgi:dihydroceramidase